MVTILTIVRVKITLGWQMNVEHWDSWSTGGHKHRRIAIDPLSLAEILDIKFFTVVNIADVVVR